MARGIGIKPPPTTPAELDLALSRLDAAAPGLAHLPAGARAERLIVVARRIHELAPRIIAADLAAKGIDPSSPRAGEPGLDGPAIILRYLTTLAATLSGARSVPPTAVREVGSRTVVHALPEDGYDALIFRGYRAEVWLDGVVPPDRVALHPSELPTHGGEVALVLGAGNVTSIGILDAVEQVFVKGRATVLKLSPVNDYQGPLLELAFAPLVKEGFITFVYGGADIGAVLASHPAIDTIHVTGSLATHEAIVWGSVPAERAERKARGEPVCTKPVTSELGNVGPAVIVPGDWTESEIEHAAQSIAGTFAFNAGFNCNATKLIVTPQGWRHRARLLGRISEILDGMPRRAAYYPGAAEKYARFATNGGRLEELGGAHSARSVAPGALGIELPWALVTGLEPAAHPACFEDEPFCSVLSEVSFGGADPVEFLGTLPSFLNERVWGTLNVMLLVPEAVERDATLGAALERAIAELRYGAVCINAWPAVAYGLGTLPWGGHPSSTLANVQSGLGYGHNSRLYQHVEKTVLRAPLANFPKPFWYPNHRTLDRVARRLIDFQASPGPIAAGRVALAALPG